MSIEETLLDSVRGANIGLHVGDSLGAYYETMSPAPIAEDLVKRGGLQLFDYPNPREWELENGETILAGTPTDDSILLAATEYSLLEKNGVDPAHLRYAYRRSVIEGSNYLWEGPSIGAGKNTIRALSDDVLVAEEARNNTIGTNGSVMRAAAMGLWYFYQLLHIPQSPTEERGKAAYVKTAKDSVYAMSAVTHNHQHAQEACWLLTLALADEIAGNSVSASGFAGQLWIDPELRRSEMATRISSRLRDKDDLPYDPGAFPERGRAEFTLYVALWALKYSTSFEHGIELAIRVGGDTDTYAAVAGSLLGARYGYSAIPKGWCETIKGHDRLIEYADAIFKRRFGVIE